MKTRPAEINARRRRRGGFTMIEIMVAVILMSMATSIIYMTFSNVVFATGEVEEMLEDLHHGEYAMNNLVTALRSSAYFTSRPEQYGFWLEDETLSGNPADWISFVTSSSAFMRPDSPLVNQMHRISLTIEEDEDGEPGLAVSAYPHLLDPESDEFENYEEAEPWIVSKRVIGLECKIYNEAEKAWEEEWLQEHRLPSFVEITLYLKPSVHAEDDEPKRLTRMIQIPLATYAKNHSQFSDRDAAEDPNAEETAAAQGAGAGGTPTVDTGTIRGGTSGTTSILRIPGRTGDSLNTGGGSRPGAGR